MLFSPKENPGLAKEIRGYSYEKPNNKFIKSLTLIELSEVETFKRTVAIVEDKDGNSARVLFYRSKFTPKRNEGELAKKTFKEKSVIGDLVLLPISEINDFESADKIAVENAKLMSVSCGATGITDDIDMQISGMSVVIMADPDKPKSISEDSLQKSIGYLFSEAGPFNEAMLFPDFKNKKFMANLHKGGVEFLIDRYSYKLMNEIIKNEKIDLDRMYANYTPFVMKAMSSYLRILRDIYRTGNPMETRSLKSFKDFMQDGIRNYLLKLVSKK